jgi:hypothetical protein
MSQTIKRIWIAYGVLSGLFILYGLSEDGDMFSRALLMLLPHLGFIMWYAFKSD